MKKLFTLLMTLWLAIGSLFAVNLKGGEVFYLTPHTTWNSDNARYAIYFFNKSTNQNTWVSMTKVEGESNLWKGTTPSGNWANLIFCRMNPSATANNWNNNVYWGGQTQDLTWDGTKNHFTVNSSKDAWDKPAGTWSLYVVDPIITVGAAPEFATTTVGETANATVTYTLENATEATATIEGEGFSIAEQSVGSVTITFAPEAEGEYTGTLTITSGDVKETVALAAKAVAAEAPKVPEFLNVTTPVFAEIIEGEVATAEVTYELVNATEATASVDGEFFSIKEQELGKVIIEFASEEAGVFEGTLTLTSGETVKEITFTATAKKAPVVITISFVNPDWTEAALYAWTTGDGDLTAPWPGLAMTKGENGKFTYELEIPEDGNYKFIINNNNKGVQSNDLPGVTESTCYVIETLVDGKFSVAVSENCEYQAPVEPDPIEPYVAIRGTMTDWDMAKDIEMTYNADAANGPEWYFTAFEVPADGKFKVVSVDAKGTATWYGSDKVDLQEGITNAGQGDGDIALPAGKYDIYFKVNEGRMWIQKYVEPTPEPDPVPALTVSAEAVAFEELTLGEEPVSATQTITYTVENSEEAVVLALESEVFTAEDAEGTITITFAPVAEGEYTAELTLTLGDIVKTIAISGAAKAAAVEPDPDPTPELEFALVGRLNGDNDNEILDYESGYKFTKESEFVYTLNVTFTGAIESGDKLIQKVKLVDAEGNIWARNSSKTIKPGDGTSTMTYNESASSTYLVTEVGVEYKITYTLVSDETAELYKLSGQLTFEKVETEEPEPTPDPEPEPEPDNTITFTVQVPEGTKECWIAGTPGWAFIQMEEVEDEENLFTVTVENTVLDGAQWKYASGKDWQYAEVIEGNGNRTEAEDPYDVVTAWQKLYDPDFEPIDPYYAIRGLNGDVSWTGTGDIVLEFDEDGNQYVAKGFTVTAGESFKVIYVDENAKVSGYYAGLEEGCNVGQTYDDMGNIILPAGKYDLYFKPGTELMWISVVADTPTDAEEAVAELIYAIDGTIIAPAPFAIIDLSGKDVTNANGSLQGTYIVKTQNSATKISVK